MREQFLSLKHYIFFSLDIRVVVPTFIKQSCVRFKWRTETHLDPTLFGELDGGVVVAAAQQVLHHHAVHALPLPHAHVSRLVAAVLLQVFDSPLAQLSALIFSLDRFCRLRETSGGA